MDGSADDGRLPFKRFALPLGCMILAIGMLVMEHHFGSPTDAIFRRTRDPAQIAILASLVAASCVPLAWRRTKPTMVLLVEIMLMLPASWLQVDSLVMIPLLVAYGSLMSVASDRIALAWTLVMAVVMALSAVLTRPTDLLIETVGRVVTVLLVGSCVTVVRGRRESRQAHEREVAERQRSLLLAAQRDEAVRRSQIAGQLHDSVGHGLTTIIALSEGLAGKTGNPAVQEALNGINEVSRESLAETRNAVRALADTGKDARAYNSGLTGERHTWDDIRPILAHARAAGIIVTFIETGNRADDMQQANLCFDVTREAITNALRHAPDVSYINVTWNHDANETTTVLISNDIHAIDDTAPGTGLIRLAHRVTDTAGEFEYGPNATNDEWQVKATIPACNTTQGTVS